jgi:hypothetical protein
VGGAAADGRSEEDGDSGEQESDEEAAGVVQFVKTSRDARRSKRMAFALPGNGRSMRYWRGLFKDATLNGHIRGSKFRPEKRNASG